MFEQAPNAGPGTADLTTHTLEIVLLLLGAWLLGLLLGYLLYARYRKRAAALTTELEESRQKALDLEQQLVSGRYQHDELQKTHNVIVSDLRRSEADRAILEGKLQRLEAQSDSFDSVSSDDFADGPLATPEIRAADNGIGAAFERSNLQIIEGIGPKIEAALHRHGVDSWAALAEQTPAQLTAMLTQHDINARVHAPDNWPRQAELAARGDWPALIEMQKFMSGAKRGGSATTGTSKVEKCYAKQTGGGDYKRNDLKIVTGISPRIEALLQQAGIRTWKELGQSAPKQLREILINAGADPRNSRPDTWPRQAQLADAANWKDLEALQRTIPG